MKEKEIEEQVLKWLNFQLNVFAFKVNTTGFFDTKRKIFRKNTSKFVMPGTPDIFCIYRCFNLPIAVFMEVKSEKGKQSESQVEFQTIVEKAGGFYFIVRSIDDASRALNFVRLKTYPND